MTHLYIGIDPDVDKCGVAIWNSSEKKLDDLLSLDFWDLIAFMLNNTAAIKEVRIEGGWLNKSNWHLHRKTANGWRKMNPQEAAEAGKDLGRNFQTGLLLEAFCQKYGIAHKVVKPLLDNWWAEDGEKFKKITGWAKRSNPETRDAAMLVFGLK